MRDKVWQNASVVAAADLGGLRLVAKVTVGEDGATPLAAITKMAGEAVVGSVGFKLTDEVRQVLRALADAQPPAAPAPKQAPKAAAAADSGAVKALEDRIGRIEALLQRLVK